MALSDWNDPAKEAELSTIDRLGLAYCRLNCWEWDEGIAGPKPEGFDDLPFYDNREFKPFYRLRRYFHPIRTRCQYTKPIINAVYRAIGETNAVRCEWIFEYGKSEEEWARWYFGGQPDLPLGFFKYYK